MSSWPGPDGSGKTSRTMLMCGEHPQFIHLTPSSLVTLYHEPGREVG
jgi:ABC-type molybdenum transport system ATPase subunit/photorepair protein PhrA